MSRITRTALVLVFAWFFLGGIAHFAFTDAEMRIVPPWVPWPRATVIVSGICELAGALGLLLRRTRSLAAWALLALTVCVTPANVYMLQHAELFPQVPPVLLLLRLPLQLALIAGIVRVARSPGDPVTFRE